MNLEFFASLANPKRQEIVFKVLADKRSHTVGEIANRLGVSASTASEHLTVLRRAGVVNSDKWEREVHYSLNRPEIARVLGVLQNWLDCC